MKTILACLVTVLMLSSCLKDLHVPVSPVIVPLPPLDCQSQNFGYLDVARNDDTATIFIHVDNELLATIPPNAALNDHPIGVGEDRLLQAFAGGMLIHQTTMNIDTCNYYYLIY